ncbi:MAG: hypothetical protein RXR74_03680 [Nitrososphaeria archaeon]
MSAPARLLHLYRNMAGHLVRSLWGLGVSRIYLGHPYEIAQDIGNKLTANLWAYRRLMRAIERMHNWLSAFMSMHNFVFENGDLGRPPLGWKEEGMPRWLNGPRQIFSLG